MSWIIVEHAPHHTPQLRQLYLEARQHTFTWQDPQTFRLLDFDSITQGEQVLVALSHEVPVGFIAWWPPDSFIHSLFVAPAHSGQGVGKALLAACVARMGRPATLKCVQKNARALGFYQAQGWVITGSGETAEGAYFLLSLE